MTDKDQKKNGELQKWLADYRIKSEFELIANEKKLKYIHPSGLYEIHISNTVKPHSPEDHLSLQIIISALDISHAETLTKNYVEKFLHILSFVTSVGFKITRRVHLIDWTPGTSDRQMYVYSRDDGQPPIPALSCNLLKTVELLHTWGTDNTLDTCLRWYSAGVRSVVMEDQFQFFWFVVELIAIATKSNERVSDKCQKCGGDLHCHSCDEISKHRPFQKQSIQALFEKLKIAEPLASDLFYVRNSLMHGETKESIETEIQKRDPTFSFDKVVDLAGKSAWASILNAFKKSPGLHQPEFTQVSTYVNWILTAKAHVNLGVAGDPNNPQVEDVHPPDVSIIHSAKSKSEENKQNHSPKKEES